MPKPIQGYAFELYYENIGNVSEILRNVELEFGWHFICSPVHDKDKTEPTFELGKWVIKDKKPHYHILVHKDDKFCRETCKNWLSFYGNSHIEDVYDEYSYFMYLRHDGIKWRDKASYTDKPYAFVSCGYSIPSKNESLGASALAFVDYYFSHCDYFDEIELIDELLQELPNAFQVSNSTQFKNRVDYWRRKFNGERVLRDVMQENERLITEVKALKNRQQFFSANLPYQK